MLFIQGTLLIKIHQHKFLFISVFVLQLCMPEISMHGKSSLSKCYQCFSTELSKYDYFAACFCCTQPSWVWKKIFKHKIWSLKESPFDIELVQCGILLKLAFLVFIWNCVLQKMGDLESVSLCDILVGSFVKKKTSTKICK